MELKLVHPIYKLPQKLVAFYDGHLVAYDGVLTIPIDGERSSRWAKNAWLNGYNMTPDGRTLTSFQDVESEIESITTPTRSAQSAEVNNKGLDTWRQPGTEHRIRQSESSGNKVIPKARVGSSQRRGIAKKAN